jgi:membrane associated rhomboid family serine protease
MKQSINEMQTFLRRFLSPAVMYILIANVAMFLLMVLISPWFEATKRFFFLLMQTPQLTVQKFYAWQLMTYMFMHADFFHLLFNMLILWFFASRLEDRWGTKRFLRFYFTVGIGAGIIHIIAAYLTGHQGNTMLGASGALYGIMLAYALNWPNDVVLLYFIIPIKIKWLMLIAGILTFLGSLQSAMSFSSDNISHVTHLGGLLVAFIYLRGGRWFRRGPRRPRGPRRKEPPRSKRATIIEVDPKTHPDFRR